MDKLRGELFAFEPATEGRKIVHAEALRAFNQLDSYQLIYDHHMKQ